MSPTIISFMTLARKECRRVVRVWQQTIVPPIITMTLYFIIFGQFIGRYVQSVKGFTFIVFLTPGLIMLSCVTATYGNTCTSLFMEKFQKSIEAMLAAPISNAVMLWGFVCGGVFRGLVVTMVISVVATFFTDLTFVHFIALAFGLILILIILSFAGFVNALLAKRWDDVMLVPTFVLAPLTYLGGVFYSLDQMSPFWRNLSYFNPIVYIVNIFRYGMIGYTDVSIPLSFAVLIALAATLYGVAMLMLKKGVGLKA